MSKHRGEYLEKNRRFGKVSEGAAWGLCVVGLIVGLAIIGAAYSMFGATSVLAAVVLLVCMGEVWVLVQVWPAIRISAKYARNFSAGIAGETYVWATLHALPAGYTAFANILLPNGRGDIDFVVTGPAGVYTVEAKNWAGIVSAASGELLVNGQPPHRNVIGQAKGEAFSLAEFLFGVTGVKVFVRPIIIFTHSAGIRVPTEVTRVWIVPPTQVSGFVSCGKSIISPSDLEAINNILRLMCK